MVSPVTQPSTQIEDEEQSSGQQPAVVKKKKSSGSWLLPVALGAGVIGLGALALAKGGKDGKAVPPKKASSPQSKLPSGAQVDLKNLPASQSAVSAPRFLTVNQNAYKGKKQAPAAVPVVGVPNSSSFNPFTPNAANNPSLVNVALKTNERTAAQSARLKIMEDFAKSSGASDATQEHLKKAQGAINPKEMEKRAFGRWARGVVFDEAERNKIGIKVGSDTVYLNPLTFRENALEDLKQQLKNTNDPAQRRRIQELIDSGTSSLADMRTEYFARGLEQRGVDAKGIIDQQYIKRSKENNFTEQLKERLKDKEIQDVNGRKIIVARNEAERKEIEQLLSQFEYDERTSKGSIQGTIEENMQDKNKGIRGLFNRIFKNRKRIGGLTTEEAAQAISQELEGKDFAESLKRDAERKIGTLITPNNQETRLVTSERGELSKPQSNNATSKPKGNKALIATEVRRVAERARDVNIDALYDSATDDVTLANIKRNLNEQNKEVARHRVLATLDDVVMGGIRGDNQSIGGKGGIDDLLNLDFQTLKQQEQQELLSRKNNSPEIKTSFQRGVDRLKGTLKRRLEYFKGIKEQTNNSAFDSVIAKYEGMLGKLNEQNVNIKDIQNVQNDLKREIDAVSSQIAGNVKLGEGSSNDLYSYVTEKIKNSRSVRFREGGKPSAQENLNLELASTTTPYGVDLLRKFRLQPPNLRKQAQAIERRLLQNNEAAQNLKDNIMLLTQDAMGTNLSKDIEWSRSELMGKPSKASSQIELLPDRLQDRVKSTLYGKSAFVNELKRGENYNYKNIISRTGLTQDGLRYLQTYTKGLNENEIKALLQSSGLTEEEVQRLAQEITGKQYLTRGFYFSAPAKNVAKFGCL